MQLVISYRPVWTSFWGAIFLGAKSLPSFIRSYMSILGLALHNSLTGSKALTTCATYKKLLANHEVRCTRRLSYFATIASPLAYAFGNHSSLEDFSIFTK